MDTRNKYEILFDGFLDLTEFTLIKHRNGWGLHDRQGGNLGDIESDRFETASDIFDRMDAYINDYFFADLENELDAYGIDVDGLAIPWNAEQWLQVQNTVEFYNKNKRYFDDHKWEFDVLDMIVNHANEINLEKVYYESEE